MTPELAAGLAQVGWPDAADVARPLAGDASARRYLRLSRGTKRAVVMCAPPEERAHSEAFLRIAKVLRARGFSAPEIYAADLCHGWILLEDLGDDLLARLVTAHPHQMRALYTIAADLTTRLARLAPPEGLPVLTADRMQEMLGVTFHAAGTDGVEVCAALQPVFERVARGPNCMILRDMHAGNLIWLPRRMGLARLGLLDFQDAMAGPAGYDLISLLDDARRDVPDALRRDLIARQARDLQSDPRDFAWGCAVLSLQRNLRIIGVFCRLAHLRGKPGYLKHLPRVAGHVMRAVAQPGLEDIKGPVRMLLSRLNLARGGAV
ncbi:MAG: phosphotransferase [Rhodobacteraceae bacterium]|nr:phosphotransferase [Paracoccaceae bacterium]